jgi:hypothetical protein
MLQCATAFARRFDTGRLSSRARSLADRDTIVVIIVPHVVLVPLTHTAQTGDLPQGVHRAALREVLNRFGQATVQRRLVGMRLKRVYELTVATGGLKRFIVFGSFVSTKPEPNDVDVFLVMNDTSTSVK